jgi:hypothetical protein
MLRAIAFAAMLLVSGRLFAQEEKTVFVGREIGRTYTVSVTPRDLDKTPSWDRGKPDPPLSARQALKTATECRNRLVKDDLEWTWKLTSIGLRHRLSRESGQKWFWVAYFQAWPVRCCLEGSPPDLYVVVLMDGSVVTPVVKSLR